MSLSPLIAYYITNQSNVLGQAFLITAISSFGLAAYAWLTKRDFSRLGDYLFFGLILLVTSLIGLFFGSFFSTTLIQLIISFFGVALFSGYVIYYVQRGKNMADTMPNAIGLTISLFLTVLNLFLFILRDTLHLARKQPQITCFLSIRPVNQVGMPGVSMFTFQSHFSYN